MGNQFIQLRHFTRSSSKGFTLLELLVTLVVASVITGLALKLIVDQRQLFLNDQIRSQVNQNSRAALDLVGTDIKQVGDRVPGDKPENSPFPVVKIISGASNTPDKLVLQRLVIRDTLPVCQTVTKNTNQSTIKVSDKTITTGDCSYSNGNADLLPDNLEQWRNERCKIDRDKPACIRTADIDRANRSDRCLEEKDGKKEECIWAYIYDPDTKEGEFFLYGFESPQIKPDTIADTTNTYHVHRVDGGTWKSTYPYDALSATNPTNPKLYILEERRYELVDNENDDTTEDKILQLTLNQQTSPEFLVNKQTSPVYLVNQLSNFQVQALMKDYATPSPRYDFHNPDKPPTAPAVDYWRDIKAIKVDVTANNSVSNSTKVSNLTLSAQFFPRNSESKYTPLQP